MLLSILFLVTHDPSEYTLIMADNNKKLCPSFVLHVNHFEKGCTLHNFIPDQEGLSLRWGPGISLGYYEHGSWLLSQENRRKIEPKEIPGCLIPRLLDVLTRQLEILVTALLST